MQMTMDVYVKAGSQDALTVQCERIAHKYVPAITVLSPATFRVLEDVFGAGKMGTMLVNWGKCVHTFSFDLYFANDEDYEYFIYYIDVLAYGDTMSEGDLEVYWGEAGDAFYTGEQRWGKLMGSQYMGYFLTGNFEKNVKGGFWRGSIDFVLGAKLAAP